MSIRVASLFAVLTLFGAAELTAQARAVADSQALAANVVSQAPALIQGSCGAPVYPMMLRAAQVQGQVLLQFVVDTLGRVEPSSIRSIRSTHSQFTDAARQALVTCRYRPARFERAAVRVLVQAPFTFALPRS